MLEKLKACGSWILGILALLAAVLFGANALKQRKQSQTGNDSEPAGKAPIVEAQAKETDSVNTKIDDINEVKPPPTTPVKGKTMENLIDEYEKL